MSKIFDLINELCPKGVEFRELGDIADIGTGSSNRQDEDSNGKYPFYVRSKNILKSNTFEFDETAIIIPGEGGIGDIFHYIDGKYALHQRAYRICVFCKKIDTKFLYYIMCCHFKKYILAKSVGATATSIRKPMLEKFKLPVPPMEVQREIVRILDSFTLLTAELTAELTARKKQYEFYRDFLLNFNEDQNEIKWDIIDNIFIMKNGYTPSKANKDFWENGTISWYRMEDIRENGRILSESIQKITPQAVKGGKLIPKNSIIVATTATIGEHALAIADSFLMNQQFTSFTIRELLKDKLDIKFVFYYFFKICEWCKQNTNSSSFPSVDMAKLKKVKFPIPSPQTQQKVVDILDKFDTLVNSITEGLPREIELRRKQYEHYRELLLNFKPKMTA
jgi:restriction modification system DNA specificity domain protein